MFRSTRRSRRTALNLRTSIINTLLEQNKMISNNLAVIWILNSGYLDNVEMRMVRPYILDEKNEFLLNPSFIQQFDTSTSRIFFGSECIICREEYRNATGITILKCGHVFHTKCLDNGTFATCDIHFAECPYRCRPGFNFNNY